MPSTSPVPVSATESAARAMPKSVTLTLPAGVTSRLAGLTSRCTIPAAWAWASASAACRIRSRTWAGSIGWSGRISSESGRPSTSSITR